ncbi:MAG: DUF2927 domain-containing protein [Flavobacterium sp.]|nr:MAG: DUF2927 domain-containing protein [Flavobacterium sp.]
MHLFEYSSPKRSDKCYLQSMKRNTLFVLLSILITAALTFLITKFILDLSSKDRLMEQQNNYDTAIYFNEICIGSEYEFVLPLTHKFTKPGKLYVVKDSSYTEQMKFVTEVLKEFNKLTTDGFHITQTSDSASANMYLYLRGDKDLTKIPRFAKAPVDDGLVGYFDSRFTDNRITDAFIFVNTNKTFSEQKAAILEEIVQSVGFFKDSDFYTNSVFYQYKYLFKVKTHTLSFQDKEIIKLLYNPKMKVGLNKRQAMEINMMLLKESDDRR